MKKILVVDDELDIAEAVEDLLLQHDYEVITANDGVDAIRQTAIHKPDLILLDVLLPKMTGYEFLKQLQEAGGGFERIPVIVMSKRESMRPFFDSWRIIEFLPKPFNHQDLLNKINETLGSVAAMTFDDVIPMATETLHPSDVKQKKIVVIGIQEFLTERIKLFLGSRHCSVYQTGDMKEAVKLANKHQPNLILCEFGNETETLNAAVIYRNLQENPMTREIRFFVYCPHASAADANETLQGVSILTYQDVHDLTEQLNTLPL
ncbi:MAG: hypothetical protein COV74_10515 [Candidatus Omnitrophica bacterium CG11_big_fil_rev_8_21_14_0_20_45_26]|uniref:Response regulatory domain-containing protein n=1 Tax=Candidatus Abzuiibacterium crystallinum TaxID=1974748 RepID=A0A2H0LKT1_9BACT|nr:MAG: hypothetical protein COV74_10515 [Candidatus Omnitrophica bacterium CG11_big_fil_rev_8_21_14_0_20_45_26]PIW63901.1 MAG: hypothetical protein COW12_08300 [Candidatus Omnitrophica bacterium CG12_big_fil_rev_8_21_14_0_65_45_16]